MAITDDLDELLRPPRRVFPGDPPINDLDPSGQPVPNGGPPGSPPGSPAPSSPDAPADPLLNMSDFMPRWVQDNAYKTIGKYTPEVLGTPDLFGIQDLMTNLSFQRLFEQYTPSVGAGEATGSESFWGMPKDNKIHMTGGGSAIWGDVDPELLPGYQPGFTTFSQVLEEKMKRIPPKYKTRPDLGSPTPPAPGGGRGPGDDERRPLPI